MTTATTNDAATALAQQVDTSSYETIANTCDQVADQCKASAAAMETEADELEAQAAGLAADKPDIDATDLLREAAERRETAQNRLQMAAAFEDQANTARQQAAQSA